ncbi:MAG TPA: hypothetical protein VIR55_13905 [Ignavibacteria bacterium]
MIDFLFFLIEAILFYIAALSISNPQMFFLTIVLILLLDLLWIAFVYLSQGKFDSIKNWGILNLISVIVFPAFILTPIFKDGIEKWLFLTFLCIVRTFFDYITTWKFYWPDD